MGHRIEFRTVFDVRFSAASLEMLGRLSKRPSDVFDAPYLGYMLVLFSNIDEGAYSWLRNHAMAMDSLSGSDLGFAIFSARIPLHAADVTRQQIATSRRPSTYRGHFESWEVRDLVESGHIQLADLRGDEELFAVNEAVFAVARSLGLTQHLPCIVAFDGIPHPEMPSLCVPIQDESVSRLFPSIRAALGQLQAHGGLREYRDGIKRLTGLAAQLKQLSNDVRSAKEQLIEQRRLKAVCEKHISLSCTEGLRQCAEAIRRGQQKHFPRLIATLAKRFPELPQLSWNPADVPWASLTHYRKTIHTLGRYASMSWPLSEDASRRLSRICSTYAHGLAGDSFPISLQSQARVEELRQRLLDLWISEVNEIISRLPSPPETILARERSQHERLQTISNTLAQLEARLLNGAEAVRSTELTIVEVSRGLLDRTDRPSFCQLLQRECHRAAIHTVPEAPPAPRSDRVSSFWTSWLPINRLVSWVCERSFIALPNVIKTYEKPTTTHVWRRPPTAFASYASEDRAEVLRRIQGMRAWQPGLDIFVDFHSLFPGERWKERLQEEILKRDRFFLFWSRAASASGYVESEWRAALVCRGLSSITPVPLEPPDVAKPPTELAALHFGDFYAEMLRYAQPSQRAGAASVGP